MPNIVHGIFVPGRADGGPEFVWYDLPDGAAERVRACTVDGVHGGHQCDWREFLDVQSVDEPLHSIIEGRASVVTWTTAAPPTMTSIDAWLVRGTGGLLSEMADLICPLVKSLQGQEFTEKHMEKLQIVSRDVSHVASRDRRSVHPPLPRRAGVPGTSGIVFADLDLPGYCTS